MRSEAQRAAPFSTRELGGSGSLVAFRCVPAAQGVAIVGISTGRKRGSPGRERMGVPAVAPPVLAFHAGLRSSENSEPDLLVVGPATQGTQDSRA